MPYLFPYVGQANIVEPAKANVFSLFPLYERQVRGLVPFAFSELGAGSVFTVANQWPGYEDSIAISQEQALAGGGRFAGSLVAPIGTNDYTPAALQIKAANPDYLVVNASATDGAKLVDALVAQNALPGKAILGVATLAQGEFSSSVDTAASARVIAASRSSCHRRLTPSAPRRCGRRVSSSSPGTCSAAPSARRRPRPSSSPGRSPARASPACSKAGRDPTSPRACCPRWRSPRRTTSDSTACTWSG